MREIRNFADALTKEYNITFLTSFTFCTFGMEFENNGVLFIWLVVFYGHRDKELN